MSSSGTASTPAGDAARVQVALLLVTAADEESARVVVDKDTLIKVSGYFERAYKNYQHGGTTPDLAHGHTWIEFDTIEFKLTDIEPRLFALVMEFMRTAQVDSEAVCELGSDMANVLDVFPHIDPTAINMVQLTDSLSWLELYGQAKYFQMPDLIALCEREVVQTLMDKYDADPRVVEVLIEHYYNHMNSEVHTKIGGTLMFLIDNTGVDFGRLDAKAIGPDLLQHVQLKKSWAPYTMARCCGDLVKKHSVYLFGWLCAGGCGLMHSEGGVDLADLVDGTPDVTLLEKYNTWTAGVQT